jgi:ComEC/Rec2-related protein
MTNRIFIGDVVFYLATGFLAGTLVAGLGWKLAPVGIVAVLAATTVVVMTKKDALRNNAIITALCLAATVAGFLYYFLVTADTRAGAANAAETAAAATANLPLGKSLSFSAIITDEPKPSTKYLLLPAEAQKPFAGELTIFAPLASKYQYGDELAIIGKIEPPEEVGDTPVIFPQKMKLVAEHRGFWLREDLLDFKAAILKKFNQFLSADESSLVAGELFGGMDGMSAALKTAMAASGTSYILAMYGYKMSLVTFLIEAALANWVGRRMRFAMTTAVITVLVVLSGGNVSAIRAAIMAIAALIAKLAGRLFDARNTLILVAASMALFDPTLPTQAAFNLSILSIAGIFYLAQPLQNFFGWAKHESIFNWREAVIIATATLLPIIPIIAISFGDFSLTAFPSNALISFAILPAIIFGAALAMFGFVAPPIATIIAKIGQLILFYQFAIIKIFAAIAIPLPIPVAVPVVFIGYYVVLIWFAHRYSK